MVQFTSGARPDQRKKFSIKQLAYKTKKVSNADVLKQLSAKRLSYSIKNTLKLASQNRVDGYIDELLLLF